MSNRQARREQMRANRQQRAAQRPSGPRQTRPTGGGGPRRRRQGGVIGWLQANPFLLLSIGLAAALVGVLVAFIVMRDDEGDRFVEELQTARADLPLEMADGRFLGSPDAPITLTTYEDFQCPFCLQYTATQEPDIIDEFVRSGQVRLEFKHLPILGTESLRAARAAVCVAEQNVFWPFQNALFLAQAEASQFDNEQIDVGRFSDNNLREFAIEAGADGEEFDACFAGQESLETVQEHQQEATQFGIQGTPGFALNGVPISGARDIEGWRRIFQTALDAASATPTGSASAEASPTGSPTPEATATPSQ